MKNKTLRWMIVIMCLGFLVSGLSLSQDEGSIDDVQTPPTTTALPTDAATMTSGPATPTLPPTPTHTATMLSTNTLTMTPALASTLTPTLNELSTLTLVPTLTPMLNESPALPLVSTLTLTLIESPTLTPTLIVLPVSTSEPEITPEVTPVMIETLSEITDTPLPVSSTVASSPTVQPVLSLTTPTETLSQTPTPTDNTTAILPYSSNMNNGAQEWVAEEGWVLDASVDNPDNLMWGVTNDTEQAQLQLSTVLNLSGATAPHMTVYTVMIDASADPIIEITTDGVNWIPISQIPVTTDWTTIDIDLSTYIDETVSLRFTWLSQPSSSDGEPPTFWLIDNVRIIDLEIGEIEMLTPTIISATATSTPSDTITNPVCDADLNLDDILTAEDLLLVSNLDEYGGAVGINSQYQMLDINGDDALNILDLQGLTQFLGQSCESDT